MPKKIAVIGLPGSGKSTFAMQLGKLLGISVEHLDRYQFIGNKKRDKAEFLAIQDDILAREFWIIEGCSFSTLEKRFEKSDCVIYLRFSKLLCIWRILKRLFRTWKTPCDSGCLNGINWTLIQYIWNFDLEKGERIQELAKKYPHVDFRIFTSFTDINLYLDEIKGEK